MKIFILEHDRVLQEEIDICLNNCRLHITIKKAYDKQALFDEATSLDEYALFVLNLKNPTDARTIDFIRDNGGYAPILLIVEPMEDAMMLKTLYYLGYNDVILKPFPVEEMVFRIYKLCDIWNNDVFFLRNGMYFDFKQGMFITKEEPILLGRKESLLLKCLFLKSPHIVTWDEINAFVYHNEVITQERIRALIKQLRDKLPLKCIKTINGKGYQMIVSS
ncbi:response regulator transcription factor [Sulfurospirillum barnesii]|uniref:Response regulator with CheY-like receiver domain and winged-helix DNA-binding domain n=1 Tax=Sulfurospirillum barnesii (strain ATCC 700032 / DSM 10660 / SES-3) TaxID=760154 RepID=I3XZY1_SULBS|nr:winged helix-turn-helix domain-containing protein [Sulfurospirillum barnesii]AFL69505.1 response regulator with CheY-like receiver domain and winged-helix DNA-binding domain [Sulfurospirillum barnesii SES-3]